MCDRLFAFKILFRFINKRIFSSLRLSALFIVQKKNLIHFEEEFSLYSSLSVSFLNNNLWFSSVSSCLSFSLLFIVYVLEFVYISSNYYYYYYITYIMFFFRFSSSLRVWWIHFFLFEFLFCSRRERHRAELFSYLIKNTDEI